MLNKRMSSYGIKYPTIFELRRIRVEDHNNIKFGLFENGKFFAVISEVRGEVLLEQSFVNIDGEWKKFSNLLNSKRTNGFNQGKKLFLSEEKNEIVDRLVSSNTEYQGENIIWNVDRERRFYLPVVELENRRSFRVIVDTGKIIMVNFYGSRKQAYEEIELSKKNKNKYHDRAIDIIDPDDGFYFSKKNPKIVSLLEIIDEEERIRIEEDKRARKERARRQREEQHQEAERNREERQRVRTENLRINPLMTSEQALIFQERSISGIERFVQSLKYTNLRDLLRRERYGGLNHIHRLQLNEARRIGRIDENNRIDGKRFNIGFSSSESSVAESSSESSESSSEDENVAVNTRKTKESYKNLPTEEELEAQWQKRFDNLMKNVGTSATLATPERIDLLLDIEARYGDNIGPYTRAFLEELRRQGRINRNDSDSVESDDQRERSPATKSSRKSTRSPSKSLKSSSSTKSSTSIKSASKSSSSSKKMVSIWNPKTRSYTKQEVNRSKPKGSSPPKRPSSSSSSSKVRKTMNKKEKSRKSPPIKKKEPRRKSTSDSESSSSSESSYHTSNTESSYSSSSE